MDFKQLLIDAGIEEDQASSIASNMKKQVAKEFVPKDQYNKKAGASSELETKISDLEAELDNKSSELSKLQNIKSEYENKVVEFNNYKADIELKESNQTKSFKLRAALKNEGFNEKMIPLLEREFDLSNVELEEDSIKGWDELSKGVKEQYGDFISQTTVTGAEPANPINKTTQTFTREQIQNMTPEQINANWDSISQNSNNLK